MSEHPPGEEGGCLKIAAAVAAVIATLIALAVICV